MKKYLLPESGNFYKANLHCHTNISDGRKTPEEIKELYQKLGYSVVAYTDHNILLGHNDLTDDKFLALNGFEIDVNEAGKAWVWTKCCHFCLIALDGDNLVQPMYNEARLNPNNNGKYKDLVKFDEATSPYVREYTGEKISDMMKIGRDAGFFITYNHPTWSRETYPEYIEYEGMHAFEMFNGSCNVSGYEDYNPRVYDDILCSGKRIFAIGADDNHNTHPDDSRRCDSGIAYTVIKADKLEYKAITDALVAGNFYSSEGPSIDELYIEDGKIHIKCSAADQIICNYQCRGANVVLDETGDGVTEASFDAPTDKGYLRLTVVDKQGRHACTNAYFPEE